MGLEKVGLNLIHPTSRIMDIVILLKYVIHIKVRFSIQFKIAKVAFVSSFEGFFVGNFMKLKIKKHFETLNFRYFVFNYYILFILAFE